jgi:hypothetical protein
MVSGGFAGTRRPSPGVEARQCFPRCGGVRGGADWTVRSERRRWPKAASNSPRLRPLFHEGSRSERARGGEQGRTWFLNGRTPSTGCRIPQGQATGWRPPHPRVSPAIFPVSLKVTHQGVRTRGEEKHALLAGLFCTPLCRPSGRSTFVEDREAGGWGGGQPGRCHQGPPTSLSSTGPDASGWRCKGRRRSYGNHIAAVPAGSRRSRER